MTKKQHVTYWRTSARHDLESAESIFATGRYDWCLFIGHLALEKILKALVVAKKGNKLPPRIHNLLRLAETAGIALSEGQRLMLDKINDFNLQTRYPDYKLEFYKKCDKEYAERYLKEIKELYQWFDSLLK